MSVEIRGTADFSVSTPEIEKKFEATVLILSENGASILDANAQATSMLGYSRDELLLLKPHALLDGSHLTYASQNFELNWAEIGDTITGSSPLC
ncbi:PAS domain-containing protein [Kiloniella sp.]|uniref:PAS domain-containing protein n=1 Tax=Kiloniella sp. TaxID=1938587 RepID=UPI003B01D0FE